jgi:hypothetical protein
MEYLNQQRTKFTGGSHLEDNNRKFHFQEIDQTICFPNFGNEKKKYINYTVSLELKQRRASKSENQTNLGDILDKCDFANNYPHTVGFYKTNLGKGVELKPDYLEIRRIYSVEEFWKFLNDLDM